MARFRGGSLAVVLLGLLTIGACAAVVGITAVHLNDVVISSQGVTQGAQCLIGEFDWVGNLCTWAYIAGGVGAGLALIMGILSCVSCKCCAWGHIFDFIVGAAGFVWMAYWGAVFCIADYQPETENWPEEGWRMGVWISAFAASACFLISMFTSGVLMCCGCCRSRKEKPIVGDVETAPGKADAGAYPADTAAYGDQTYNNTTTTTPYAGAPSPYAPATTTAPTQQYV